VRTDRFVILGNGGAALSAAGAARLCGYDGEVHLVSDADEPAFNPMLSPYYFKGKIPWDGCYPFGPDFYRAHDLTCHFGSPVVSLDARDRVITFGDDRTLPYDRCLIATGAAPVIPPIPGLRESARVFCLRDSASARRLDAAMRTARKAVVLGVSLVGMKLAEILVKRGIEVVLVGRGSHVLGRGAHASAATLLERHFRRHGVDIRLGCTLERLEDTAAGATCHLSGGTVEEADIVLVCMGVRPNLAFVDRAQVAVDTAVLADAGMRTNIDGLYAAGDACQALNPMAGRHEWRGTWGGACHQGRAAGEQVAGRRSICPGALPEHVSPFFDWSYAHIGDIEPKDGEVGHVAFGDPEEGGYALIALRDGIVTGANLINCTHLSGWFRGAILRQARHGGRPVGSNGPIVVAPGVLGEMLHANFDDQPRAGDACRRETHM
jgi:NADPH-dependent 2,4-dienoyl-CoA reductase/sulfur reductase-like enzyme